MTKPSRIPVSVEAVRARLDYDPITGLLTWKRRDDYPRKWNTRYAGKVAGSKVKGYFQIQFPKPRNYYAHVLAWLHFYGEWRPFLDHRNGVRSDNRIENLRPANSSQNCTNKARQRNNTSGFVGVCWNVQRKMWESRIWKNRKCMWRRFFDDPKEAAEARQAILASIHGEFSLPEEGRDAVYDRRKEPHPADVRLVLSRGTCELCGAVAMSMHVDHKLAVSRGGANDITNLQLLCPRCNLSKGCR